MEKTCKNCGTEFKTYRKKAKFCTHKCYVEWIQKKVTKDES